MTNLAVACRSFANVSDKESKWWTDLSIRYSSLLVNLILSILEQRFVTFLLPGTSGAAVRLDVSVFFSGPPPVADTEDAGVSVTL